MKAHKEEIDQAEDKRRQTQREFGRYWRMQMDWNAATAVTRKQGERVNPEQIWTIEGPTRKAQERLLRQKNMEDLKNTLLKQQEHFKNNTQQEKESDRAEGQRLQEQD